MNGDATAQTVVQATGLAVCFGEHEALRDVTMQVAAGQFVAIVGPNGSGKTTLLKALLGLVPPSRGRVRLFGQPPREVPAGRVGYVPQIKTFDRSFPAVAVELVASAVRQRWPFGVSGPLRKQAEGALRRVGASHLADRPLGELSGGELQRIYLARSMIHTPPLLVLDEPATGVDRAGAVDLYHLLEQYQQDHGAAVVMVTHDWNAAYHHAARVLVLDRTPVSFGPPQEALAEAPLRKAFGHVGHAHAMRVGGPDA